MSLTFSVITPSYNQGEFIERTIQSVLAQTDVEYEYVVFDGGSTDNTVAILKQYQSALRWVSEPDEGQADAVNKGIYSTTGDIIAWINSDDIYYPAAFRQVQAIFAAYPQLQVIYGQGYHIAVDDQVIEQYPSEPWNYRRLKEYCFICQPATFFRRELVNAYGPLNAKLQFCMDYELWLRYGQHTDFYYLPKVLGGSRFYPQTKTMSQKFEVHFETNEMLKEKFSCSPEKWVFAYAWVVAEKRAKSKESSLPHLKAKLYQLWDFITELFQGYRRWRTMTFFPLTGLCILRWSIFAGCRFLRKKPSILLSFANRQTEGRAHKRDR